MFRFTDQLIRAANAWPDQPAVSCAAGTLTWSELSERCHRLAMTLATDGVGRGDRVAFLGFNGHVGVEVFYGVPLIGAASVPLNFRLSEPELIEALLDCEPTVVIADADHTELIGRLCQHCPSVRAIYSTAPVDGMRDYETALATAVPCPLDPGGDDDMLVMFYTGGTTGRAKGVMQSHTNLYANSMAILSQWDLRINDTYIATGPMFHSGTSSRIFKAPFMGMHIVLMPRFSTGALMQLIERHRVTVAQFVPTMLAMMLDDPDFRSHDTSSLRLITYGAAPMPPELLIRTMKAFPGVRFGQGFGMTEAAPMVTMMSAEDYDDPTSRRLNSVGRTVPFVDIRVVDENRNPLPVGQIGELVFRGPNIMLGYWRQPEQTAAVMEDNWYHSGDAGYIDADGYVYLSGRIKDMIITGGENVYPIEVEQVLDAHPAVRQAAVIGTPDPKWGERVHAVIELFPGQTVDSADLIAFCRTRLAHYKCPTIVSLHQGTLPLTKVNKIDKQALRAVYNQPQDA